MGRCFTVKCFLPIVGAYYITRGLAVCVTVIVDHFVDFIPIAKTLLMGKFCISLVMVMAAFALFAILRQNNSRRLKAWSCGSFILLIADFLLCICIVYRYTQHSEHPDQGDNETEIASNVTPMLEPPASVDTEDTDHPMSSLDWFLFCVIALLVLDVMLYNLAANTIRRNPNDLDQESGAGHEGWQLAWSWPRRGGGGI